MANLKRTRNKLLRNGYLPNCQVNEVVLRIKTVETWIDAMQDGTPISFYITNGDIDGAFKIHGRRPDQPEVDEFNSDYSRSISEAIGLSRAGMLGVVIR
mgnify:CR=1 FL=1